MVVNETMEFGGVEYSIKIGKQAQENWDIIKESNTYDVWFHLGNNLPSPHIILELHEDISLKKVPRQVIKRCCVLCKSHSNKYKSAKNIPVIYTQIKNISFGEHVGSVFTKNIKQIII